MVEFNPETQYVVRNKREDFNDNEELKPTVAKQIEISFGNAEKTEFKKYGDNNKNWKNIYYDANGKELGSVCEFKYETLLGGKRTATVIKTEDANYFDWDNNGTIDCKDTDNVYDRKSKESEEEKSEPLYKIYQKEKEFKEEMKDSSIEA